MEIVPTPSGCFPLLISGISSLSVSVLFNCSHLLSSNRRQPSCIYMYPLCRPSCPSVPLLHVPSYDIALSLWLYFLRLCQCNVVSIILFSSSCCASDNKTSGCLIRSTDLRRMRLRMLVFGCFLFVVQLFLCWWWSGLHRDDEKLAYPVLVMRSLFPVAEICLNIWRELFLFCFVHCTKSVVMRWWKRCTAYLIIR